MTFLCSGPNSNLVKYLWHKILKFGQLCKEITSTRFVECWDEYFMFLNVFVSSALFFHSPADAWFLQIKAGNAMQLPHFMQCMFIAMSAIEIQNKRDRIPFLLLWLADFYTLVRVRHYQNFDFNNNWFNITESFVIVLEYLVCFS